MPAPKIEVTEVPLGEGLGTGYGLTVNGRFYTSHANREDALGDLNRLQSGEAIITFRQMWGLGDIIALSGAAVALAKRHGARVTFPFLRQNRVSAEAIFSRHPEIVLVEVSEWARGVNSRCLGPGAFLTFGAEADRLEDLLLDQYQKVYATAGLPYTERWDSCPIPEVVKLTEQRPLPDKPYILIHEDASRGYLVDRDKVPKDILAWVPVFSATPNILVMADWIENAEEIHVMDSCVFHLTNQLNPRGKLFLHQYVRMKSPTIGANTYGASYKATGYHTYGNLGRQWTEVF